MERVELPVHEHPLIPFTSFAFTSSCRGCLSSYGDNIYEGYRCSKLGCEHQVFHKECAESLPEIIHSSHPDHPLKLFFVNHNESSHCGLCRIYFEVGYSCSICNFELDLRCARRLAPLLLPEESNERPLEQSNAHEHPLKLFHKGKYSFEYEDNCKLCDTSIIEWEDIFICHQCNLVFHVDCIEFFTEAYHTSHPKHPLKFLSCKAPDYADKECLLCGMEFDGRLHHCNVCNFSICSRCMKNPPPFGVVSPTTHEHQLHLVPRHIGFTCNGCGTNGVRSPYFCLQCNFMIHRECIDLPRVININRHDHRISYTRHLGHGNWKCGVCRKEVNGFYGAYSCSKCSNYAVHSLCATREDVWDMIELEGTPEEPEEIPPFEEIDEYTIKHFSHDHNLRINKGGMNQEDGRLLEDITCCQACVFQIGSESFYSCEQCNFILHQKCANLPRKKRHPCHNQRFILRTKPLHQSFKCTLCNQDFTGFRYETDRYMFLDVRCSSISEPFMHKSHQHPLYYYTDGYKYCSECGGGGGKKFSCDECDFSLDYKCAVLPQKVLKHRYDDHPLFLSFGESNVDGQYWCEACEAKLDPKKRFYTCNDCGITLHISCVVGDFSYIMPSSRLWKGAYVVANTSICRILCSACNSRCKLSCILVVYKGGDPFHFCSFSCHSSVTKRKSRRYL